MGVIDLRNSGSNPLAEYLTNYLQQQEERRREERRMQQQKEQFDATHGLDKARTDAFLKSTEAGVGHTTAQTAKVNYDVSSDRASRILASAKGNYDRLVEAGQPDKAALYMKGIADAYKEDPEVQAALIGMFTPRDETDLDVTAANLAGIKRGATERVLGGGEDVGDQNLSFKLGTGDQLSGPAFADQQQVAAGPQAYNRYRDIEGGRAPNANVTTQIAGQERMSAAQIAAQERMNNADNATQVSIATQKVDAKAPQADAQANIAAQAIGVIQSLRDHPGMGGAVGVPDIASAFGMREKPFPGTSARDYVAKLDRLKALLTIDNLKVMRGLGHMSDREFKTLENVSAALDRGMPETAFAGELADVESVLQTVAARAASQAGTGGGRPLDADTAAKILQAAGGDKNKAREIARQAGYAF